MREHRAISARWIDLAISTRADFVQPQYLNPFAYLGDGGDLRQSSDRFALPLLNLDRHVRG